jgi:hypothetical protein
LTPAILQPPIHTGCHPLAVINILLARRRRRRLKADRLAAGAFAFVLSVMTLATHATDTVANTMAVNSTAAVFFGDPACR